MIETEKATDRFDLPHAFDRVNRGDRTCVCGRVEGSTLHDLAAREVASSGAAEFPRELGS